LYAPTFDDDEDGVTLLIDSATLGIEKDCFCLMQHVSRVLVCGPEPHNVQAVVLALLIAKLRAYELDVVDAIYEFVMHSGNSDTHCVGDSAFRGCTALREMVLPRPRSITHVDTSAFQGCITLTSVTLPDSLTHVGDNAFFQCTSLTSITLPKSLVHIGVSAFSGCASLRAITLPNLLAQ
jgi:hypothetical protein